MYENNISQTSCIEDLPGYKLDSNSSRDRHVFTKMTCAATHLEGSECEIHGVVFK